MTAAIRAHGGAIIRNFGYRAGPPEIVARLARGEEVDPALHYMPPLRDRRSTLRLAQSHHLRRDEAAARE